MLKNFFSSDSNTPVDGQIDAVLQEMQKVGVNSADYPELMTKLERLSEVKAKVRRSPVSRDTIAIVAGNVLLTLIIVAYEQKHVMTSKGFNQIIRPRELK